MFKRIYPWIVGGIVGLLLGAYFPNLTYLSYKLGLIDRVPMNGVQLIMGDGWFPLLNNKSWLARLFVHSTDKSGAIFFKVKGWKPGTESSMFASARALPLMDVNREDQLFFVQTYPWGQAKILKEVYSTKILEGTDYKWVVILEGGGLVLHVKDLATLNEIYEIKKI